jgi:hypothetical protein
VGVIIEDLYDHEGYGVRRLPDGTLTATWSAETAAFDAYVAACGCGWHGGEHPPTDDGYEAAVDQWEHDHARPLLAKAVPIAVSEAVADAKQAIANLSRQRPEAARRVLDDLGEWARRGILATEETARRMEARLQRPVQPHQGSPRRLWGTDRGPERRVHVPFPTRTALRGHRPPFLIRS